jgi:hypothetical protein
MDTEHYVTDKKLDKQPINQKPPLGNSEICNLYIQVISYVKISPFSLHNILCLYKFFKFLYI